MNQIAKDLVALAIVSINNDEVDTLLNQIQNPVHKQIAKMVVELVEEVLVTVKDVQVIKADSVEVKVVQ